MLSHSHLVCRQTRWIHNQRPHRWHGGVRQRAAASDDAQREHCDFLISSGSGERPRHPSPTVPIHRRDGWFDDLVGSGIWELFLRPDSKPTVFFWILCVSHSSGRMTEQMRKQGRAHFGTLLRTICLFEYELFVIYSNHVYVWMQIITLIWIVRSLWITLVCADDSFDIWGFCSQPCGIMYGSHAWWIYVLGIIIDRIQFLTNSLVYICNIGIYSNISLMIKYQICCYKAHVGVKLLAWLKS